VVCTSLTCGTRLKVICGYSKSDELPCAVAWHPKGDFFVVPTRSHGKSIFILESQRKEPDVKFMHLPDIAIVDRDSWTRQGNFSASGHDGEIGLLAWSPNGMYLASSGKDDQIIVWETESKRPVSRSVGV
jgi:chromosome transmission fidelity protein 4